MKKLDDYEDKFVDMVVDVAFDLNVTNDERVDLYYKFIQILIRRLYAAIPKENWHEVYTNLEACRNFGLEKYKRARGE